MQRVDGHALPFKGEFDAVFTNAALHWMRRPKLVIAGVRGRSSHMAASSASSAAMATWRPSPRRCGRSVRCITAIRPRSWFFPSVAEYRRLLEQGGFAVKSITLMPRLTPREIGMQGWLETFGRSFFEQFEEPERSEVLAEVLDLLRPALCDADGVWIADHIRLRFLAERIA